MLKARKWEFIQDHDRCGDFSTRVFLKGTEIRFSFAFRMVTWNVQLRNMPRVCGQK